jgi:hypothetical protein
MWGNTVAIHSVFKKKTMKLNSQPAQYKKNRIDKDYSGKKNKKIIKKKKKNHVGKHCSNSQCFFKKKLQS